MTFTDELYDRLPEVYRANDTTGVLRKFLDLLGTQANDAEVLYDRIDFVPVSEGGVAGDSSELVDATKADVAWLPWLAQMLGVRDDASLTEAERRDAITYAISGWRVGTKQAVADAARTALTGTKYASVYDHTISSPGDGGQWDVLIVTATSETPDVAAVLAAVLAKKAKPAGVVLRHRAYTATWAQMEATYGPAWSARNGKTWAQLQEAGL